MPFCFYSCSSAIQSNCFWGCLFCTLRCWPGGRNGSRGTRESGICFAVRGTSRLWSHPASRSEPDYYNGNWVRDQSAGSCQRWRVIIQCCVLLNAYTVRCRVRRKLSCSQTLRAATKLWYFWKWVWAGPWSLWPSLTATAPKLGSSAEWAGMSACFRLFCYIQTDPKPLQTVENTNDYLNAANWAKFNNGQISQQLSH